MGNYYSTILKIKNREHAPEIVAFATELTKTVSMEEMGFDLTDPANHDEYHSFNASGSCISWHQYSSYPIQLNEEYLIDAIVHRFQDTEFIHEEYWEGPLSKKEYIKGDYREELVKRTLIVGVDSPDAFTKLSGALNKQHSYPFFIFPLGDLPVSKVESKIDRILNRIAEIVHDQKLYCILKAITESGNYYVSTCFCEDGETKWQDVPYDVNEAIWRNVETWDDKPDDEVFKILFVRSYREQVLSRIKAMKEEAERLRSLDPHYGERPF